MLDLPQTVQIPAHVVLFRIPNAPDFTNALEVWVALQYRMKGEGVVCVDPKGHLFGAVQRLYLGTLQSGDVRI